MVIRKFSNLILLIFILTVSACSPKTFTPYYKDVEPNYDSKYLINSPLILLAEDKRPYVVSGDKKETFYGLVRSGFGIPYSIYGNVSASNDFLEYVYLLLESSNSQFSLNKIAVEKGSSSIQKMSEFKNKKPIVLFDIKEWKTDQYKNAYLYYDIDLIISNKNGTILLNKNTNGKKKVVPPIGEKKSIFKPIHQRWYQKAKVDAIGELLLNSEVINVINSL